MVCDHDRATNFYKKYGFVELQNHPNRLFLPMTTRRDVRRTVLRGTSFDKSLTGAANTIEERKTMRPYLRNKSLMWITLLCISDVHNTRSPSPR